jgi:uncharacterized HAD superfamily protein
MIQHEGDFYFTKEEVLGFNLSGDFTGLKTYDAFFNQTNISRAKNLDSAFQFTDNEALFSFKDKFITAKECREKYDNDDLVGKIVIAVPDPVDKSGLPPAKLKITEVDVFFNTVDMNHVDSGFDSILDIDFVLLIDEVKLKEDSPKKTFSIKEWEKEQDEKQNNLVRQNNEVFFNALKEKEDALIQQGRNEVKNNLDLNSEAGHDGHRYNKGKPMLGLLPADSLIYCANVLTKSAKPIGKYEKRNWENGLSWSETIDSLERHVQAFKNGEDYDEESGEFHLAHAAINALFILHFYKHYPEGDDRNHSYYKPKKIGLDIDEVICDWVPYWTQHYNQPIPHFWHFDRDLSEKLKSKANDKEFWLNIPTKINAKDLSFEPSLYLTKRPVPNEWTQEYLDKNGFPHVDCITIQPNESKLETLLQAKADGKLDIYVDDNFETFCELNKHGITTYLMDTPHNKKYNVGYKRIYSLKELS